MCRLIYHAVCGLVCLTAVAAVNSSASDNADVPAIKRDTTYAHYGYSHQGAGHDRQDYNPDRSSYGGGGSSSGGGYGSGGSGSPGMSALALLGFLFFLNMISQTMMMPMMPGMGRRKRSSVFPDTDEDDLWSLLHDASHVGSSAMLTYARALEAETDTCVQRLLCEMNRKRMENNNTEAWGIIGQMASTAISYALHGDDVTQHDANLLAANLGERGESCEDHFQQCATMNAR